jgi:hypothetical protein
MIHLEPDSALELLIAEAKLAKYVSLTDPNSHLAWVAPSHSIKTSETLSSNTHHTLPPTVRKPFQRIDGDGGPKSKGRNNV